MGIKENIRNFQLEVGNRIKIIAVSKYNSIAEIMMAYDAGQRRFGENKVQELMYKRQALPKDIEWHFLGHLQTNKVRYITPFISMIQSVDSLKILKEIDKEGQRSNRIIPCLLQFHIGSEETKFGLDYAGACEILSDSGFINMEHVVIAGVMGMASFTENTSLIRSEFSALSCCFQRLRESYFMDKDSFSEISMGMSGDYKIAIEEGSTMIRLGTILFGERNMIKTIN